MSLCPKCGHELKQGELFCTSCGFPLSQVQASSVSTQQAALQQSLHFVTKLPELLKVHRGTLKIENDKLLFYRGKVEGEAKESLNLSNVAQVTSARKVKSGGLVSGIFVLTAGLASAYFAIANHSLPSFSPLLKAISPYELFYSLTIVLLLGALINISDALHGRLRVTWVDHAGKTFRVDASRHVAKQLVDRTWIMSPSAKGAFPVATTVEVGKPPKKHRERSKLASGALATVGGILIVISGYGTSTSGYMNDALRFAAQHLGTGGNSAFVNFITLVIGGVSVAGILVMAGGIEMFLNHGRLAKLLLEIGGLGGLFTIALALSPYLLTADYQYIMTQWDKWVGLLFVAVSKYVY